MRRHKVMMVLAAAVAVWCAVPLAATGAAAAGSRRPGGEAVISAGVWRNAIEVPGTAVLNAGGTAGVNSMSCSSAGNCAAGGQYADRSGHDQAFVASERNGTWHKAIEVPGTAALNAGADQARGADVTAVSCSSAGNCAAVGGYEDRSGSFQAFVASERNGTWRKAIELPGTAALNAGGDDFLDSVSCNSVSNCAVGGGYEDRSGSFQAFVASERNGTWLKAIELRGTGALNVGGHAVVNSLSCGSAGNCAASGSYDDRSGHSQAFVASERNGTWHKAIELPGTAALNVGGSAVVNEVSCSSAGNCAAGGLYTDRSGHGQAFVASERNGTWHKAIEVPGTAALNAGGSAAVHSLSCGSAGYCAAGGSYEDRSDHVQAFVASERNGTWHKAIEVPGSAALNAGEDDFVSSVSCSSPGNCAAGGFYTDRFGRLQAFIVSQA